MVPSSGIYLIGISSTLQDGVIPTHMVVSIKNCKTQVNIYPSGNLCHERIPFMEIDDKGGEFETKI